MAPTELIPRGLLATALPDCKMTNFAWGRIIHTRGDQPLPFVHLSVGELRMRGTATAAGQAAAGWRAYTPAARPCIYSSQIESDTGAG